MRYAFLIHSKPVLQGPAVGLKKLANISAVIVEREVKIIDTIQSLLIYVQAFEEYHVVRYDNRGIMDIAEDLMYSDS